MSVSNERLENGQAVVDPPYWDGSQTGITDIEKRAPIIDTGIVDPNIAIRTEKNCKTHYESCGVRE